MDIAFARAEGLAMRLFRNSDLNSLSRDMLEIFLKESGLPTIQQAEIMAAPDKTKLYIKALRIGDLNTAQNARVAFYNSLEGNGIFLQKQFYDQFSEIHGLIVSAFVEQQLALDYTGTTDYKAFAALQKDGKKKKDQLLLDIRARLWSSASHVLPV